MPHATDEGAPARLLLVSNRLPVTLRHEAGGDVAVTRSAGGLATALARPHAERDSLWIGWPGEAFRSAATRQRLERQLRDEHRCVPVFLSARDIHRYYDGISNRALWPLLHLFQAHMRYEEAEWAAYVQANQRFCEAVVREARGDERIWVHDYHLFLLPAMLRAHLPAARIGFFLHTPFPPPDLFRIFPHRDALLQGVLGADVIGFQTFGYVQNFLWAVYRVLGLDATTGVLSYEGRQVLSAMYPISVDPAPFLEALQADPTTATELHQLEASVGSRKLLLGMDRLDYSKGIPERLRAYQWLLAEHPEWRERTAFLQVSVPSREKVLAYQELRRDVDALVGEINGTYGTTTWTPVQYLYRNLPFPTICALLRRADVALVTPLRDGMNLVAKEYVVCQGQRPGALLLSEFAGASAELGEAFFVNPYDPRGMAARLHEVLSLPEDVLADRMQAMHARVCTHTVHVWAQQFLDTLEGIQPQPTTQPLTPAVRQCLRATYAEAARRVLLLNYEGTLTPLVAWRDDARPPPHLRDLVQALQRDVRNVVAVLSGHDRRTLERAFGACGCWLVAEHGAWVWKPPAGLWRPTHPELTEEWKATVRPLLAQVVARTPGSSLEEKDSALVWHYRLADPDFGRWQAHELFSQLQGLLASSGLRVQHGPKMIEIRWAEIHKGTMTAQLLAQVAPADWVLAIGDDRTDDDMFAAVPADQWTVKVGPEATVARFSLPTPAEVLALLRELAEASQALPPRAPAQGR
jgi:trehalose 6-phosphate synthase/phosphatase